ncbi:chemotaxis protein CheV [Alloscardovia theropitheci]|uniref:Chemotaxis protein CheV n=1 Tax=Alloscardovia theropitheci TaxID=2496842 RepID=A0A4R0QTZ0_9BIFI|nr:chloride channel protein [Alloscardovia theropitheci]TCD54815.1 chemotaxis protein CheV [Alloscardovia theropitheci]
MPQETTAFNDKKPRTKILIAIVIIFGLGAIIGLGAALLSLLLEEVQSHLLGATESVSNPSGAGNPWRRVASIILASIIAAVVWWVLRAKAHVPSVSKAVKGEKMPFLATLVHVVLQIFIVGAGMSVGRETAPRELGSLFGQRLGNFLKLTDKDISLITAVAAGAGFAGVYDAPLAGMFFAVEILLANVSMYIVMLSFGTSAVAAFTAGLIKGHKAFYNVANVEVSWQTMLLCLIIGPLMGAIAYFFRRTTSWASSKQTHNVYIVWQLPLMGAVTAAIAYFAPQIMGNGRALAQFSYNSVGLQAVGILLLLASVKWVVTVMTIRSGASGGVLTPAIAVGGALGAIIAILCTTFLPGLNISIIALIASAAFLATSQKAPLMASCLMIELSHSSVNTMVAVGVAVALSVLVSMTLDKMEQQVQLHNGFSQSEKLR